MAAWRSVQHFANIFLNKLGQAIEFANDPSVLIYTERPRAAMIPKIWRRLGVPQERLRFFSGNEVTAQVIIWCVPFGALGVGLRISSRIRRR